MEEALRRQGTMAAGISTEPGLPVFLTRTGEALSKVHSHWLMFRLQLGPGRPLGLRTLASGP